MTTQPLSLRRGSSTTPKTLLDAISQPIRLGSELGRGGEGSVYEVEDDPSVVVKVYHKTPLADDQVAKLQTMAACWSKGLEAISSWPRSVLFDAVERKPCGLLMLKMADAHPLHELYGTTNRRRHFPGVGWHHLVLAARNVAAAFHTLHSAGIVVGDVNQGNLLVDPKMCVRMIDCDSFQISRNGTTYGCPVGSAHFTPPELQGLRLRDVVRTTNHDRFGMATLIFHLLFVGRHPFAGRYRGPGDMSIEKAIAESRFAFSRNKSATQVDPPPASLLLDDVPRPLADLFEGAFRPTRPGHDTRPAPQEWIEQLELLLKRRRVCDIDDLHIYSAEIARCPWCRIEDVGGPSFFVSASASSTITSNRLARLDDKVRRLPAANFPELTPERIAIPTMPRLDRVRPLPRRTARDVATAALVASWVAAVGAAFVSPWALAGAAALAAGSGAYLLFGTSSRDARLRVHELHHTLAKHANRLQKLARTISGQQRTRQTVFDSSAEALEREKQHYHAEGEELAKLIIESRHTQQDDYLRGLSLRDNLHKILGMTASHVTVLESYGVETAYDVERIKLYGVPGISGAMMIELLNWRAEMERRFVFRPEHGVTLDNLKSLGDAAVQRYKMSLARKILMADERLQALVSDGKNELVQALTPFDEVARQWRRVARELCDFQKSRRPLERWINRSPAAILFPTLGVLAVAALVCYLLGS